MKNLEFGFKDYDELIFGNNQTELAPFTKDNWNLINKWYWTIAGIIGGPLLIAIVVLAWKMIVAGISPDKRNEVKDNLMRLFFGVSAIALAPIFVKLMLLLNNNLVTMLVSKAHGSLDDLLGNSLLTSINTGNAIATAIVIALFAYLFVKINIKFIIRQFTLTVFTIFTPIVAVFWIINKRTIASSIWFRTNNNKCFHAICICVSIFNISNIFTNKRRMGCKSFMGNDDITTSEMHFKIQCKI